MLKPTVISKRQQKMGIELNPADAHSMLEWPWRAVEYQRKNIHWQKHSEGVGADKREERTSEVSMVTLAPSLFVLDCKCNKVRNNAQVRSLIAWAFFHTMSPRDKAGGPVPLSLFLSHLLYMFYTLTTYPLLLQMPYNIILYFTACLHCIRAHQGAIFE